MMEWELYATQRYCLLRGLAAADFLARYLQGLRLREVGLDDLLA